MDSVHQNGIDKETKEKQILDQIKRTKNTIDDIKITGQVNRAICCGQTAIFIYL